jgi:thiosulfate/3-mercaptopyruvate sulfurtransferase
VLLRHIPIAPDTFAEYGIELPEYTSLPTWKYTSPHNIQRHTPQNESCSSCHGMMNLFLTEGYILIKTALGRMRDEELEANQDVIFEEIP